MPSSNVLQHLDPTERYLANIIAQFAWHTGQRVRAGKVIDEVDFDTYTLREITRAKRNLVAKGYIQFDDEFITRTWQ